MVLFDAARGRCRLLLIDVLCYQSVFVAIGAIRPSSVSGRSRVVAAVFPTGLGRAVLVPAVTYTCSDRTTAGLLLLEDAMSRRLDGEVEQSDVDSLIRFDADYPRTRWTTQTCLHGDGAGK